jgi:hypothetical protein
MSLICITKSYDNPDENFVISYFKQSIWLRTKGKARVMLHLVVKANETSIPFSSLKIVIQEIVKNLKDTSYLLLDEDHMKEYEEIDSNISFKILDKEKGYISGHGGAYYVTNVTFSSVFGDLTEITINLSKPIMPGESRGFRIEFETEYAKKNTMNREMYSYSVGIYDSISSFEAVCPVNRQNIIKIEYGDVWVVLPEGKMSTSITPPPNPNKRFQ